jgi:non-homologous end joining protein Ku
LCSTCKHIVEQKWGHFDPSKFEARYEAALQELLQKKQMASDGEAQSRLIRRSVRRKKVEGPSRPGRAPRVGTFDGNDH